MEDTETWVAKREVVKLTGLTNRTLERKVQKNILRREYRDVPGRTRMPVYHPYDVQKLVKEVLPSVYNEEAYLTEAEKICEVQVERNLLTWLQRCGFSTV